MKLLMILLGLTLTACGTTQASYYEQSKAYCESLSKAEYCAQLDTCHPYLNLNCANGE